MLNEFRSIFDLALGHVTSSSFSLIL